MVKRTLEQFDCDVCGELGQRYSLVFPDGTLAMDRCEKHAAKILKMREEKGSWFPIAAARSSFKISSLDEILSQKEKGPRP